MRYVQRASYREIVERQLSGKVDVAWLCGYPYTRHQQAPLYRSYLITPAEDTQTRTIADLRDRVLAYSDLGRVLSRTLRPALLHGDTWQAYERLKSPLERDDEPGRDLCFWTAAI